MNVSQPARDRGRILFGAAYYAEYQPTRDVSEDLDLMRDAGFSVIRVGESVWTTWEPRDGEFDLEWLLPVLDGAHERGIAVILGTPTYALPPWLARAHPDINARKKTGQPMGWGRRQEINYHDADFRRRAERVIRAIAERYASHPAVIGYQVDNEPGIALLHNEDVFARFVLWLRSRYGTVEKLNDEWGLVYWSHRLTDWDDLWRPDGNAQPQYDQAWRTFQAEVLDEFIAWQAAIVREYARDDQFVTTCYSYFVRPAMNDESCSRVLDIVSGNAYFRTQDALALPSAPPTEGAHIGSGAWRIAFAGDRMYSGRQAPFLVTETNAGSIGPQWLTEPPWDGQWRQIAWLLIARGAQMIEYWHWQTLQYGAETYWHGVLPHSRQPGRVYEAIAELGREIAAAGEAVAGLRPRCDVGFLYSEPSRWAAEFSPFLSIRPGVPDPESALVPLHTFYRATFEAGLDARILHVDQLTGSDGGAVSPTFGAESSSRPAVVGLDPAEVAREVPVLVAAGLTVLADRALEWLRAYVIAGGHLVLGPRTGYHDEEARARTGEHPAGLADLAGVAYSEYSTLDGPVPVAPGATISGAGTGWLDYLCATEADVLARYASRGLEEYAAVASHAVGTGRITTVSTVPDDELARSVVGLLGARDDAWTALRRAGGSTVTVSTADAPDGVLRVVHNWSWDETEVVLPQSACDVATGERFTAGDRLTLREWDVRPLLVEAGPRATGTQAPSRER